MCRLLRSILQNIRNPAMSQPKASAKPDAAGHAAPKAKIRRPSRAMLAAGLTIVCILSTAVFLLGLEYVRGPEALGLILPFLVMEALHVVLGLIALVYYLLSGRRLALAWIPLYFGLFIAVHVMVASGRLQWQADAPLASMTESLFRPQSARLRALIFGPHPPPGDLVEPIRQAVASGAGVDIRDYRTGITPLIWAVHRGQADLVELFLAHGADPNRHTPETSPLLAAASRKQSGIAARLLDAGADVAYRDQGGRSPLSEALHNRDTVLIRLLAEHKADLNESQEHDQSFPLLYAVRSEWGEGVSLLLSLGADPNRFGGDPPAPLLMLALHEGSDDIAQRLLDGGADANQADSRGEQPLPMLLEQLRRETNRRAERLAVVRYRLAQRQGRTLPPPEPSPPDDASARKRLVWAQSKIDLLEALVAHGAQFPQDGAGFMLRNAVDTPDQVGALLLAGADPRARAPQDELPLAVALKQGRIQSAQLLLEAGADPNAEDPRLGLPLSLAVAADRAATVGMLLAAGADPNRRPQTRLRAVAAEAAAFHRLTPVELAFLLARVDAARKLLAAGGQVPADAEKLLRARTMPPKSEAQIKAMRALLQGAPS
jgi:ankyrin repeat protein